MKSDGSASSVRTAIATVLALIGFAANSILCRKALGSHAIDAWSFTCIRLGGGALTLFVLVRMRAATTRGAPANVSAPTEHASTATRGSWPSAFALFAYAAAFSLAYLRLGAGVGALVLFACVQATMIGWGIKCGERPSRVEWSGFAIALAGLAVLTLPGAVAPDPIGLALMMIAGAAWGAYSLRGRSSRAPLVSTADNFARSVPMAIVGAVVGAILGIASASSSVHIDANGVWLALASGCVASGLGYSLWYSALPGLTAARAAIVQLVVPILAATLGIVVLGEELSARLAIAAFMILGGIALAIAGRRKPAVGAAPTRADRSDRAGESSPLNAETPAR